MKELESIREFFETGLKGVQALPEKAVGGKQNEAIEMLNKMLACCDAVEEVLKNWNSEVVEKVESS